VAGGTVTLEPVTVAFAQNRTLTGALLVDDVQLGDLVAETGAADRVKLDATVDGRIPFQFGPAGLRISGGVLRSVRPGRLSISREALTQVGAAEPTPSAAALEAGQAQAAPPNAFQEFAYQALENLAYSELDVAVESRPEGRLGLIFKMRGRHDPPQPEEARISIMDLLRGRAFQRRIPLPDDAPVNLTLDSSINLDELLRDYGALRGARSDEVQP
jgi:hypothetical protein